MSNAVESKPPSSVLGELLSKPIKPLRGIIARILEHLVAEYLWRQEVTKSQSPLLHAVCSPVAPAPEPAPAVLVTHDQQVYSSYVAFCKVVGAEPHTIEYWDSLRDKQRPSPATTISTKVSKESTDEGYRVCPSPAGEPARFKRSTPERPITFDGYAARAASCPSLPTKQIEMEEFAYRTPCVVNAVKPKGKTTTLPFESRWCRTCAEYVEQEHVCYGNLRTSFPHHYKTATGEHTARRVKYATARERETLWLKRVAEFETTWLGFITHVAPCDERGSYVKYATERELELIWLKRVAEFETTSHSQHKLLFDKSFQGFGEVVKSGTCVHTIDYVEQKHGKYGLLAETNFIYKPSQMKCCTKSTCKHLLIRSFTFSTGATIEMCPGCTTCDAHRKKALRAGHAEDVRIPGHVNTDSGAM